MLPRRDNGSSDPPPTAEQLLAMLEHRRRENEATRVAMKAENAKARRQAEEARVALQLQAGQLCRLEVEATIEPPRDFHPLTVEVEAESMPPHYLVQKLDQFTGWQDLVDHLKKFQAQMLISGGSDALRCKMFVGTLARPALDWFAGLANRAVGNFEGLSRLFVTQFAANKERPPTTVDLFDVRQLERESLKAYLTCFNAAFVKIRDPDENMVLAAFTLGLRAGPFAKSLIWLPPNGLADVRARAS